MFATVFARNSQINTENFPPGSSQVSIYQGPGQHLICNYDVPIMFNSKLDFIKNLLELNTDASVIGDAFELKECTSTVDILLDRCFKLNITPNFNLPQYHQTDQNKISNPDLSSFYVPTLLHFAAHYNLVKFSIALLKCPGAAQLLVTKNYKGLTPMDIAAANGHLELTGVLSRFIDSITNREDFKQFVSITPNTEDYYSIYEIAEPNDSGLNDKRNSISSRISTSSNDSGIESKDTYVSLELQSCSKNHKEKKISGAQEKSQIFQRAEDDIYDVPPAKTKNLLDRTISLPANVLVPPVPDRLPNVNFSDRSVKRLVPPSPDKSFLLNKYNDLLKEQYKYSSHGDSEDVYEIMTSPYDLDQNPSIYDKPKSSKNADKNDAIEIKNICEEIYDIPPLNNQSPLNVQCNRNQHLNNKQQDSQKSMFRRHTAPNSTHTSNGTITDSNKSSQKQNDTTDYYELMSSSYYASSNKLVQQNNPACDNEDLYDSPTKTADSDNDEYVEVNEFSTDSDTIYDVPTDTFQCGQHKKNPNLKKLPDRIFVSPLKINKDEASIDTSSYQKAASTTRRHSTPVLSADDIRNFNNLSRPPVLPPRQVNNFTCSPRLPPPRK
ncbi:uncharacterized protein LOC100205900 [Hydra vulgaris]|uniref:uncharacterized protein LOC100205900 n=1 Tax=Hydra vulgaris TaxID=6087 RepID=UPI0032EA34B5